MKRIFIAVKVEPGNTLMSMLSDMKTSLKNEKIKWTDPENFHITLAFLGDTEEEKIRAIGKMLKRVTNGSGEFELVIKGAGVFKNIHDPRVLWTGIEPSEKLNNLFKSVKAGLEETGSSIEERNFNPHLTLGRIKSVKENGTLKSLIARYQDVKIQTQEIEEVILYESILFHSGPVYKPLGKFPLTS